MILVPRRFPLLDGPRRRDAAAVAVLVGTALVAWWPTRHLEYHWDGAAFVVDAARDLRATGFSPFVAGHSDFAHPPLAIAWLAAAWSLFGETRLVSHLVMLPFVAALLVGTYVLGRRAGASAGIGAALVVASAPVVLSETAQIYIDLPCGAVFVCGLAAWTHRRLGLAGALFTVATLIKIPAVVGVASLAVVLAARPGARRDRHAWLALAAPFAGLAVWLVYHHAATGWWLSRPGRALEPFTVARFARDTLAVAQELLTFELRYVLLALVLVAGGAVAVRKRPLECGVLIVELAVIVMTGCVFFGYVGEFGMRYAIFLVPPFAVLAFALVRAAAAPWVVVAAALSVIAVWATTWHPKRERTTGYTLRPDDDLGVLDMIAIGRQAGEWLERHHAGEQVFGSWPESYQLTEPWHGYVNAPVDFHECEAFREDPAKKQLVFVHPYSPGQMSCKKLTVTVHAHPIKRFESNGKWLEVWRVPRAP